MAIAIGKMVYDRGSSLFKALTTGGFAWLATWHIHSKMKGFLKGR
jgi:hypothetical protein